jgi:hypothetical protein
MTKVGIAQVAMMMADSILETPCEFKTTA